MNTTRLSPLTMSGLRARLVEPDAPVAGARQRAYCVTAYECPICGDLHIDEAAAEDCCQHDVRRTGLHDQDFGAFCPVCGVGHKDEYGAADCCLWHDLSAPARWRIAAAVEAGAAWADAISAEAA